MKYDVVLVPRNNTIELTIEAASPQLAAKVADGRSLEFHCDVAAVNGMQCLGKCERCSRHVFDTEQHAPSGDDGVMCGLCVKELRLATMTEGAQ